MTDLEARLLAAHASDDRLRLAALYEEAAAQAPTKDAQAFYLVHAYVFALETNHPNASAIHARLKELGREA